MLVTVGLPLWQAEPIVWLALESLVRQEDAGEWELIICEELSQNTGLSLHRYSVRLQEAGCKKSTSVVPVAWVPLGTKWMYIADASNNDSRALLLQAADCYAYPHRIHDTKAMIEHGATWVQSTRGPFYDIETGTLRLFDRTSYGYPTGLNIAIEMQAMRALAPIDAAQGVDGALWNALQTVPGFTWVEFEGLTEGLRGLDTHGANKISSGRGRMMERCVPPFVETNLRLRDCVPDDVAERLEHMQKEVAA